MTAAHKKRVDFILAQNDYYNKNDEVELPEELTCKYRTLHS